jgi:hypothetical protein
MLAQVHEASELYTQIPADALLAILASGEMLGSFRVHTFDSCGVRAGSASPCSAFCKSPARGSNQRRPPSPSMQLALLLSKVRNCHPCLFTLFHFTFPSHLLYSFLRIFLCKVLM